MMQYELNKEKTEKPKLLSEFARLVGILTNNETARASLIASGRDLSRQQRQRKEVRDLFWATVVEPLFNDSSMHVDFDLRGFVSGTSEISSINPNGPVPQYRCGTWLKEKFFGIRALFTTSYRNWSTSGQNNSEGVEFHKFLPRSPNSTYLSLQARMALILIIR